IQSARASSACADAGVRSVVPTSPTPVQIAGRRELVLDDLDEPLGRRVQVRRGRLDPLHLGAFRLEDCVEAGGELAVVVEPTGPAIPLGPSAWWRWGPAGSPGGSRGGE